MCDAIVRVVHDGEEDKVQHSGMRRDEEATRHEEHRNATEALFGGVFAGEKRSTCSCAESLLRSDDSVHRRMHVGGQAGHEGDR